MHDPNTVSDVSYSFDTIDDPAQLTRTVDELEGEKTTTNRLFWFASPSGNAFTYEIEILDSNNGSFDPPIKTASINHDAPASVVEDALDEIDGFEGGFTVTGFGTEANKFRVIFPNASGNFGEFAIDLSANEATPLQQDVTHTIEVTGQGTNADRWNIVFPGYQNYELISTPYITTDIELDASQMQINGSSHDIPLLYLADPGQTDGRAVQLSNQNHVLVDSNPDLTHVFDDQTRQRQWATETQKLWFNIPDGVVLADLEGTVWIDPNDPQPETANNIPQIQRLSIVDNTPGRPASFELELTQIGLANPQRTAALPKDADAATIQNELQNLINNIPTLVDGNATVNVTGTGAVGDEFVITFSEEDVLDTQWPFELIEFYPVALNPDLTGANFEFRLKTVDENSIEHVTDAEKFLNVTNASDLQVLLDGIDADVANGDQIKPGFNVTGDGVVEEPWRILFPSREVRNFDKFEVEFPSVTYGRNLITPNSQSLYFVHDEDILPAERLDTQFKIAVRWFENGDLLESETGWLDLNWTPTQHQDIEDALRALNLSTDDDINVAPAEGNEADPYIIDFNGTAAYELIKVTIASGTYLDFDGEDITEVVEVTGAGLETDPWIIEFPGYVDYDEVLVDRLASVPDLQYDVIDVSPELTVTGFGTEQQPWIIDFGSERGFEAPVPSDLEFNPREYSPLENGMDISESRNDISRIIVSESMLSGTANPDVWNIQFPGGMSQFDPGLSDYDYDAPETRIATADLFQPQADHLSSGTAILVDNGILGLQDRTSLRGERLNIWAMTRDLGSFDIVTGAGSAIEIEGDFGTSEGAIPIFVNETMSRLDVANALNSTIEEWVYEPTIITKSGNNFEDGETFEIGDGILDVNGNSRDPAVFEFESGIVLTLNSGQFTIDGTVINFTHPSNPDQIRFEFDQLDQSGNSINGWSAGNILVPYKVLDSRSEIADKLLNAINITLGTPNVYDLEAEQITGGRLLIQGLPGTTATFSGQQEKQIITIEKSDGVRENLDGSVSETNDVR
ncbi:MAG: hypothetical protein FI699_09710, partial [SAR202 cluster bacterium]|nr:hypothetical protein [SAR202 cluster bacterium]